MDAPERPSSQRARPRFAPTVEDVPLTLPPGKEIARVISVSRAPSGDLYLVNSNAGPYTPADEAAWLPCIVRLDSAGRYLGGWGAESVPDAGGMSQWPAGPENVEVDEAGDVWITGWREDDHAILRFSADGRLLRRYGQRGAPGDNASTTHFRSPPSVYHDVENHELFVADGYGNTRVIAIDSETGAFTRMWGAYGKNPAELSPEEGFGRPVHKVARAPDGLIYVCDRIKNRVQEFELIPGGVRYLREVIIAPGTTPPLGSAADVAFTADNRFMFVSDMMAQRVWSVDRESFQVVGWANAAPETEGVDNMAFGGGPIHRMTMLPNGDLIVTRTRKGVQRMRFLGVW
jgi:hypothetical protein